MISQANEILATNQAAHTLPKMAFIGRIKKLK